MNNRLDSNYLQNQAPSSLPWSQLIFVFHKITCLCPDVGEVQLVPVPLQHGLQVRHVLLLRPHQLGQYLAASEKNEKPIY